jgi:hypothetical protein
VHRIQDIAAFRSGPVIHGTVNCAWRRCSAGGGREARLNGCRQLPPKPSTCMPPQRGAMPPGHRATGPPGHGAVVADGMRKSESQGTEIRRA